MKATLERLRPEDVPRLWELCREQNERDGTDYGPPNCFLPERDKNGELKWTTNPNVPLALKLVSGGRILQGYTFERRLEFSSYGTNPRATATALKELPARRSIRRMTVKMVRSPTAITSSMATSS